QSARAGAGLRPDLGLQRHQPARRPRSPAAVDAHHPDQAHQDAGLHHLQRIRAALR
ncbi:hypothetical protein MyNCGM121_60530, partial [Achromobacter xylosoxidans]